MSKTYLYAYKYILNIFSTLLQKSPKDNLYTNMSTKRYINIGKRLVLENIKNSELLTSKRDWF